MNNPLTTRRALVGLVGVLGLAAFGLKAAPRVYNARKLERLSGRRVYEEHADAAALLGAAQERARREKKQLLVILGGNWCQWCLALDDLITSDQEIRTVLRERFVLLELDGDAAIALDEAWGKPTRLGVPVMVFLDQAGQVARVQDSVSLEAFGGRILLHDRARVLGALQKAAG